jgi:hypothetical protein
VRNAKLKFPRCRIPSPRPFILSSASNLFEPCDLRVAIRRQARARRALATAPAAAKHELKWLATRSKATSGAPCLRPLAVANSGDMSEAAGRFPIE